MMALELVDTKCAGVIQPDPAPPKPASRARRMAPDRSGDVLDAWLCTVLGLTPSASRPQRCPGPVANPPGPRSHAR